MTTGLLNSGVVKLSSANSPQWINNIAFQRTTVTFTFDAIKVTAADGSDLSAVNPGFITMQSNTAGLLDKLDITSNVTLKFSGCSWGYATFGDSVNHSLYIYAINDNGSLKWGISPYHNFRTVTSSGTTTTIASVTTFTTMLVNSALVSSTCNVYLMGLFLANFTDTGGSIPQRWAITDSTFMSSNGDQINPGLVNNGQVGFNFTLVNTLASSWTNNFYWTSTSYGVQVGNSAAKSHGAFLYTASTTTGDSLKIINNGLYSLSLITTIAKTNSSKIEIQIIKNQTTTSDGAILLSICTTDSNAEGSVTSIQSIGQFFWLAANDLLTVRRTTPTGSITITNIELYARGLIF